MRRAASTAAALAVLATSALVGIAPPATAADEPAGSAMTRSGQGQFAGLEVTVSQTKNLVDQVVEITWEGGRPTTPSSGRFEANYLQIMQCWGDDEDGPDREQCQFGGMAGLDDNPGGPAARTRQATTSVVDPLEEIEREPGSIRPAYVPFRPVEGKSEDGGLSQYFDALSTNEVPYARTLADGTGVDYFTVQTAKEAAGLGCGAPTTSGGSDPRSCWLVVVPRGDREVDGSAASSHSRGLQTSPLSRSNWQHRLVFPLEFELLGKACAMGGAERKISGHEVVTQAVLRWQPTLCADGSTVYGYSQLSDDANRRALLRDRPGLTVITRGLTAEENTDKRPILYAPLAIDALTVAFSVDRAALGSAPAEVKAKNGRRIKEMRLTPRLVAKLITQSYRVGAHPDSPSVTGNPMDMVRDPEFKALNPEFDGQGMYLAEMLLPVNRADVIGLLWTWLQSDADAKAFLAGKPDPWGMTLNKDYHGLELPIDDFPKSDSYCVASRPSPDGKPEKASPQQCTLDLHPYAEDMLAGARAAARGDTLTRGRWDTSEEPYGWKRDANQPSGARAVMALTDVASAQRYGLETASLRNASGTFVEPTSTTMQAAVAAMQPSGVPSVLTPGFSAKGKDIYPLTSVSYAATAPTKLDEAERKDYAKLLTYAAGPGQVPGVRPGTLPYGYAPLTAELRKQTNDAAARLLRGEGSPGSTGTDADDSPPDKDKVRDAAPAGQDGPGIGSGTDTTPADAGLPGSDGATGADVDLSGGSTVLASAATPSELAGLLRFLPLLALVVGVVALAAGPGMIAANRHGVTARGALAVARTRLARKRPTTFAH